MRSSSKGFVSGRTVSGDGDNNSRIVPRLRRIRDKIERVLDAQNASPELLATDLCIPMPGSPC